HRKLHDAPGDPLGVVGDLCDGDLPLALAGLRQNPLDALLDHPPHLRPGDRPYASLPRLLEQLVGSPAALTRLLELPLQLLHACGLSRARRLQTLELTTQLALALALDLPQLRLQLGNAPLAGAAVPHAPVLAPTLAGVLAAILGCVLAGLAQRLQLLLRS